MIQSILQLIFFANLKQRMCETFIIYFWNHFVSSIISQLNHVSVQLLYCYGALCLLMNVYGGRRSV